MHKVLLPLITVTVLVACVIPNKHSKTPLFSHSIALLQKYYNPVILGSGKQRLIVVPELQGRVMQSTNNIDKDHAFGWINLEYLSKPHTNANAAIGGAERLWFGPETGQYSVFFEPGKRRIADNIRLQPAMSTQAFNVVEQTHKKVIMQADIQLVNHSNFIFNAKVLRQIELLDEQQIEHQLSLQLPSNIEYVAFAAETQLTNIGDTAWAQSNGLLSIWHLSAFEPSDSTVVVVPLKQAIESATEYFSPIKHSHTRLTDNYLFYKADAEYMNKTGIAADATLPVMLSYDPTRNLVTLITFNIDASADATYVNSTWVGNKGDYEGEIINIFNDGPDDFGNYFGPFYELETSSAAWPLKPNQSQQHWQRTYHFQGATAELDKITLRLVGLTTAQIKSAFKH
ncbi:hypothetical protein DS2_05395 [Catenovulum agarivorans DS-2]|uniref:Lipoprotein n=1 Tax=Catenovulum agarivorans DS-2 TaxID=1328313 RepID=W7QPR8_9ALTE|nr:DUF6786 family protein [Catenovulum agarivorans]EWH10977.1 hypothetical protein DS2_05395 [Catenovulum agarivorans DS-2]